MLWLMTYESRIDYFFTIINLLSIPQRCNVVLISFMISEVVLLSPGNFILSPYFVGDFGFCCYMCKNNGGHWPPSSYIFISVMLYSEFSIVFFIIPHILMAVSFNSSERSSMK